MEEAGVLGAMAGRLLFILIGVEGVPKIPPRLPMSLLGSTWWLLLGVEMGLATPKFREPEVEIDSNGLPMPLLPFTLPSPPPCDPSEAGVPGTMSPSPISPCANLDLDTDD